MTRECCECVKSAAGCGPRAPKRSQSLIVDTFLRMFLVGRASPSSCAWSCGMCTCTCANQTHAHACATVRRHPHIVNAPATSKKRVFDFSHTSMPWKPIFGRKLRLLLCRNKAMSPAAPLGTTVSLEQFPGRGGQRRLEGFGNLAELDWWRSRSGGSAAVLPESVQAEFKLRFRNLTSVSSVI